MRTDDIIRGLRCCYDTTGELDCESMCPFVNVEGCRIRLHEAAAEQLELLASEVKRLESLVQPIGKNPCDGCDHGWGSVVGYKNGKVESKSCMEECQLLKEYLEKQKEGQPCCP